MTSPRVASNLLHKEITGEILGNFFQVHHELGCGFLESVYVSSLALALRDSGLLVRTEQRIEVIFRGRVVGVFVADLVVEDVVIVEAKVARSLTEIHEAQLINYLNASDIEVGLLLNFGLKAEFRRRVHTNERKIRAPLRNSVVPSPAVADTGTFNESAS